MNIKNSLLSIVAATFVIGCGSSSNSNSEEAASTAKSIVCLDVNENSICDDGESSEKVVSWADYLGSSINSKALNNTNYPLSYNGEDGLILTAASNSNTISPWTTIVHNELKNNPSIENISEAEVYLMNKLGLSVVPSKDDLDLLASSILEASKNKGSSDISLVIKSISDKLVEGGSLTLPSDYIFDTQTVSGMTTLSLSPSLSYNFEDIIKAQIADGWVNSDDTSIRYFSASNGKVLAASRYHNALTILDTNTNDSKYNSFGVLKTSGHHIQTESGASESRPSGAKISIDGKFAYFNLRENTTGAPTGLYRTPISDDSSVLDTDDTSNVFSYNDNAVVSSFNVSSSAVALINEDYLVVTDLSLQKTIAESPNKLTTTPISYAVNSDGSKVYSVYEDKTDGTLTPSFVTIFTNNSASLVDDAGVTFKIELSFKADSIKLLSDTKAIVSKLGSTSTFAILDLVNKTASEFTVGIGVNVSDFDISPNEKMLALVSGDSNKIVIFNIQEKDIQATYELEKETNFVAFASDSKLAYVKDDESEIEVLDIFDSGKLITAKEKLQKALESVTEETINLGDSLLNIKNNISLAKSYGSVAINWATTLPTNINVDSNSEDIGKVTRPDNDTSNVSGTLTQTVTTTYRNEDVTLNKVFNVDVIKKPMMLSQAQFTVSGRSDYMASNDDGSVLVAPIEFKNSEDESVYGIASYTTNEAGEIVVQSAAKLYDMDKEIVGVGVSASNAIGVSSESTSVSENPRIFSVALDVDGNLADTVLSSVDITSGKPVKVEWNSDQSKAAVMIEKEDETFITQIYDVPVSGIITYSHTIEMGDKEYKSYGPVGISEDGMKVFQRDGDSVHASSKDTGLFASVKVDDIARVWTGAQRVFVFTYSGVIYSYNENLEDEKKFNTGTRGRMYGGEVRTIDNKNYLFIPVQRSSADLNGIYKLELKDDGSLEEIAFSKQEEGADRMAVSKDGKAIFFSFRNDNKERLMAYIKIK